MMKSIIDIVSHCSVLLNSIFERLSSDALQWAEMEFKGSVKTTVIEFCILLVDL